MPSLSPLIAQVFDDPHARARSGREGKRRGTERFASKGRVAKRRVRD
jgi:hypothetical protein